ncbi:virulence-related protein [Desulfosporosinus metallidurans]|uniref:Virulence-related protein n=1 Tax=Desulfosporosinus metallidurans TaxID=1888891 RepID=A0A1Q8QF22_9FIRM|nr:virulence-related protein [Desulfosporosinus metallidurans]
MIKLFESKKDLILTAIGVQDGNIEIEEDKVIFPLFAATLDAERIIAYEQFCTLLNQMALKSKTASSKKTESDNPKFTFRVFLIRLGMIGDEYKMIRKILLERLEGNSAFRSGSKPEKVVVE